MFIIGNILLAIAEILGLLLWIYQIMLIAYCLISWVNPDPYNPIVRFLRSITEPILWRTRKYLPFTYIKGLDLSPIVVLIGLQFVRIAFINSLTQLAQRLNS